MWGYVRVTLNKRSIMAKRAADNASLPRSFIFRAGERNRGDASKEAYRRTSSEGGVHRRGTPSLKRTLAGISDGCRVRAAPPRLRPQTTLRQERLPRAAPFQRARTPDADWTDNLFACAYGRHVRAPGFTQHGRLDATDRTRRLTTYSNGRSFHNLPLDRFYTLKTHQET